MSKFKRCGEKRVHRREGAGGRRGHAHTCGLQRDHEGDHRCSGAKSVTTCKEKWS